MRNFIKKNILFIIVFLSLFNLSAGPKQTSQIVKAGHWIYDELETLSAEARYSFFLEAQPISIGEINFYLNCINYEDLSNSGKASYNRIKEYINDDDNFSNLENVRFYLNAYLNPELYYKSNQDIDWSFKANYIDYPITFPIILGWGDMFTIESQPMLGKTFYAASDPNSFTNIPISANQMEFNLPKFAYFSFAQTYKNWGFSLHVGHQGMKIGQTHMPSIIYNDKFATDFYTQLSLYNKFIKFTININQIAKDKYLYFHELSMKPFKFLNIGCVEGSFLNAPFELRYMNPLFFMHQFASWYQYDDFPNSTTGENYSKYNEGRFCAFLGFHFELVPFKNLRIYGLYGQNEILDAGGSRTPYALSVPDSIAAQVGVKYDIPLNNSGYIKTGVEAIYASPFYMVKHSPDWSLYRDYHNTLGSGNTQTWMGTPFGPDNFAIQARFDYEPNTKWSVGSEILFSIHGENNTPDKMFNEINKKYIVVDNNNNEIFTKDGTIPLDSNMNIVEQDCYYIKGKDTNNNEILIKKETLSKPDLKKQWYWNYYPSVKYASSNDETVKKEAVKEGRYMWMTGIPEYKSNISFYGHYKLLRNLDLIGKINYSFVFNNNNILNNFAHGCELTFAVNYKLF